jgi:hypothetical protein
MSQFDPMSQSYALALTRRRQPSLPERRAISVETRPDSRSEGRE